MRRVIFLDILTPGDAVDVSAFLKLILPTEEEISIEGFPRPLIEGLVAEKIPFERIYRELSGKVREGESVMLVVPRSLMRSEDDVQLLDFLSGHESVDKIRFM